MLPLLVEKQRKIKKRLVDSSYVRDNFNYLDNKGKNTTNL